MKEKTINILIQILGKDLEIVHIDTLCVDFMYKNKNFCVWYKTFYCQELEDNYALPNSEDAKKIGMKIKEFVNKVEE